MKIKFSDIDDAYFFSDTGNYEHQAFMNLKTGEFYYVSDYVDPEAPPLPDDLEENHKYILIPYKDELDLPHPRDFILEKMPGSIDTLNEIFSYKGAYRRFKDWLIRIEKVNDWHAYYNEALEKALRAWCKENDITLVD